MFRSVNFIVYPDSLKGLCYLKRVFKANKYCIGCHFSLFSKLCISLCGTLMRMPNWVLQSRQPHTYVHTHTYIPTHIHTCMHACIHIHINTHTHVRTYLRTYVHTYIRIFHSTAKQIENIYQKKSSATSSAFFRSYVTFRFYPSFVLQAHSSLYFFPSLHTNENSQQRNEEANKQARKRLTNERNLSHSPPWSGTNLFDNDNKRLNVLSAQICSCDPQLTVNMVSYAGTVDWSKESICRCFASLGAFCGA